ncbi:DUF2254 domain-containing protein [Parvularcula dongshanensis]|uniref:Putative membrane protein n=1 Tax=Parvularcula dongshanensis TaxID=1173995 RepID=A0A840I552_9PROT|nr:DUF2254 domain-containing protein [Parvularcula dongshanensis]MBB4659411.1 putative membrane protein [Parvularcula dongshanensis]
MLSGRLLAGYRNLVASYAFLPGLLIGAGTLLAAALTAVDTFYEPDWMGPLSAVFGPTTAEGARSLLSTVGGSMLSVAGIVFSVTLAAIVFASGQYGPHVLPQYRRDKLAQATLGVMLGVFAYCMTALYSVQAGEDAFVPRLAVFGALVLSAVGLSMLIAFISHMLVMLHVSNVVGRIGNQAAALLAQDLPCDDADARHEPRPGHEADFLTKDGDPLVRAEGAGYVLTVGTDRLVAVATRQDLRADLLVRPGDYVTPRTPLLRVAPTLEEGVADEFRGAFAYGRRRTPDEDTAFTLDELCAIGLRALSPGVNDPFTATDVVHQMMRLVERAARGRQVGAVHRDEDGTPRLRRPVLTFGDVVRLTLERIGPDAAGNVTVTPELIAVYDGLLSEIPEGAEADRLRRSARAFRALCEEKLPIRAAREEALSALDRILARGHTAPAAAQVARLKAGRPS